MLTCQAATQQREIQSLSLRRAATEPKTKSLWKVPVQGQDLGQTAEEMVVSRALGRPPLWPPLCLQTAPLHTTPHMLPGKAPATAQLGTH